jgi:uracil-DNA glycosylase
MRESLAARDCALADLLVDIRACRACIKAPKGKPLAHEPRPVLQVSSTARLAIFSQAPGGRSSKRAPIY